MNDLIDRARIVLTAAVTWLVAIAGALVLIAGDLAETFGADHAVVVWLLRLVAWLAVAVMIIRRVTPVLDTARGILPPADPATPITPGEYDMLRVRQRH